MKNLILLLIRIYKWLDFPRKIFYSSLGLPIYACRHTPTCAEYASISISRYGTIRGGQMALKRLLTCRPSFKK